MSTTHLEQVSVDPSTSGRNRDAGRVLHSDESLCVLNSIDRIYVGKNYGTDNRQADI